MVVILVMPDWSLKETECRADKYMSTAYIDSTFCKEANAVETEVESLSTILISGLGEDCVVGTDYWENKTNTDNILQAENLQLRASHRAETYLMVRCYSDRTNGATEASEWLQLPSLIHLRHLVKSFRAHKSHTLLAVYLGKGKNIEADEHWPMSGV